MKKYLKNQNEKGITLIVLAVTIVVILILAAITVDISFSENGILKAALGVQNKVDDKVQKAEQQLNQLQTEILNGSYDLGIGVIPDSNYIVEGDGEEEGNGGVITRPSAPKIEVTGTQGESGYYNEQVIIKVIANNKSNTLTYTVKGTGIDQGSVSTETSIGNGQGVSVNRDGIYTITAYEYNRSGQKSEGTTVVVMRDTVAPNAQLNITNKSETTIEVQFIAIDPEPASGLSSTKPYTFYYKENGTTQWIEAGKASSSSYTYTGLNQDKTYDFKAEAADKAGNIGTSNELINIPLKRTPKVSGTTEWTKNILKEQEETSFTMTVTQPVKIEDSSKVVLTPNETGSSVKIEAVQADADGYATEFKVTVTGGNGNGQEVLIVGEGTLVDNSGNSVAEFSKSGLTVNNNEPKLSLKYKDSTGKTYTPGTWTNQNVYTEVSMPANKTVEKYQYSYNGNDWYDIGTEVANMPMQYTMTFPTDSTKPEFIGELTSSNATYHFVENGNGGIVSNNQGVHSSTSSSYIPIDLQNFSTEMAVNITVNATISGEKNYDLGYATITNSTSVPSYNSSTGQFIKQSGEITTVEKTTTITGGELYYLHFGFTKDYSTNKYNDEMVINSITFQSDTLGIEIPFYNYTKTDNTIRYTLQDEINNTFQIQAVYTDGTLSEPTTCDVKIDKTAPVIGEIETQSYETLTKGTVQVSVEDRGSGMGSYYISLDATTPTAESNWIEQNSSTFVIDTIQADTTYYLWVKDNTGNLSEVKEVQLPEANYQIDGSQYAATLKQAIEVAKDNSTITLLRDYIDESTVNFTKDMTLDTGNYTLTRNGTITVNSGKNVTIQGNGKITSGTNEIHTITNSGNLIVKGNTTIESLYTSTSSSTYAAIYNYVSTTVQENAIITGYNGIYNNGTGYIVNVQGGLVKGTGTSGDGIYNGTVTVTGGRIEGNRYGIYSSASNKITIGNANTALDTENPIVYGKTYGVYMSSSNYTFTFHNGKLMADGNTTYAGVANIPEGYVTYDYYGYEERAYCTVVGTEVSNIQIHANPLTWTNQDVAITIYYPNIENATKQYSIDGTSWIIADNTRVVMNITENTTIYARILNGNQVVLEQAEKVVDYIDKQAPEVTLTPAKTRYYLAEEQSTTNIEFTIQVEEQGNSGMYTQQYAWTTGEEEPIYTTFESGIQIQKTVAQGTYNLWLVVKDRAGNVADVNKIPFIVEYQEAVAQIEETKYTTIQEAVDACADNTQTTIILLKGTDEEVIIPETKNVMLDLQGYTVGSYHTIAPIFKNAGTLQIIDTSTEKTGSLNHYAGTAIQNTGTLTIGDNTTNIENETPTIQAAKIGIENTGTFNYYDGSICSRTPIYGNITDTPEGYGPVGRYENNRTTVTLGIVAEYVARIDYQYYTTLQNAINACTSKLDNTNQQEITLLKDIVLTETATTYKGQNIKLDLDGYTISSNNLTKTISNMGHLEITDESIEQNGKIEMSSNNSNIYGINNASTGSVKVSRRNRDE